MAKPPKAVIFDLDGTLVVSTVDFLKFRRMLLEYVKTKGADMREYDLSQMIVTMLSKFEEEMRRKNASEETIQRYLDEIEVFLNEVELEKIDDTVPMKGAEELLKLLKQRGIKIGILTRGCPEYADRALKIAGLQGYADAIGSRDRKSGILPKPNAQAAEAILKELKVEKEDTIMIGDYSIDFNCAKNSGIRFIGIVSGERSRKDLIECGCREFVENLDEFRTKLGL